MSVSSTDRKQDFTLDQIEDEFDFLFKAMATTDIKCKVTTAGTTYSLTYTTDYTVDLDADGVGGVVTLVDPTLVSKGTLTVYRETTDKQESDYDDYNQFPANTLESDLDRRTLKSQEATEDLARSAKLPITSSLASIELPDAEASKIIGWNSSATALQNFATTDVGIATLQDICENGSTYINAGTDHALYLSQEGVLAAGKHIIYAYSNATQINASLVRIHLDDVASIYGVAEIINDGTAFSLYIEANGVILVNNAALWIYSNAAQTTAGLLLLTMDNASSTFDVMTLDNDGTGGGINMTIDGVLAASKSGFKIYSNAAQTLGDALINIINDNASSTIPTVNIQHDGNGAAIAISGTAGAGGWLTNTRQPCFLVHKTGSAQSDIAVGSPVTVTFATEIFDVGSNFATNTFTAPVTGKYQLNATVSLNSIDSAATYYELGIQTSNRIYVTRLDPRQFAADIAGPYCMSISIIADMDAGDTAYVEVTQSTGTQQTDINFSGADTTMITFFSGALLF